VINEAKLKELTAKYGRIKHVVYNGIDIVFRAPSAAECDQHAMSMDEGGAQKTFADRLLQQQIIVVCGDAEGPEAARMSYAALLQTYPYAYRSVPLGTALQKLTGVVVDNEVKSEGSASVPNGTPRTSTRAG
jgi:hypothetical protein